LVGGRGEGGGLLEWFLGSERVRAGLVGQRELGKEEEEEEIVHR
jgi:hypothetical protein